MGSILSTQGKKTSPVRETPRTPLRRIKQSRTIEQTQRDATDRAVEERHRQLQSSRALTQDRGPRYGGRPWTGDRSTSVLVNSELIGA